MSIDIWKKIESKEIADCRVFKVHEVFCENSTTNEKANFYVIDNPDWVNIIALTEDEKVVLIEQYRQGTEEVTLEIPGGMVDENEEPSKAAERELTEETGFVPKEMIYLGKSRPNPAIQSNWIYHFYAKDCYETGNTQFDEHEDIRVKLVNVNEVENLIESEKISHSLVVNGFYRFEKYRKYKYETH